MLYLAPGEALELAALIKLFVDGMSENSASTIYEACGGGFYRFQVDGYIHFMIKRSPSIRYFKTLFVPAEEVVWLGDKTNCHFVPVSSSRDQEQMFVIEETQEKIRN